MADATDKTLNGLLAALHAERVQSWEPAALQVNIDQRRRLVVDAAARRFVRSGDTVDPFTLDEVGGETLASDTLLRNGPLVLVFFRFAGCPACNIALPYYQRYLAPGLAVLGANLVAVSPQVPERLVEIKRRHQLDFFVAADRDNTLARRLDILYSYDEASRQAALAKGRPIGEVTGTNTWELPMPAVIVIGQDGVVRFADVSPDWLDRTEAGPVLDAVRTLRRPRAA
jgi:peroxiredoxin